MGTKKEKEEMQEQLEIQGMATTEKKAKKPATKKKEELEKIKEEIKETERTKKVSKTDKTEKEEKQAKTEKKETIEEEKKTTKKAKKVAEKEEQAEKIIEEVKEKAETKKAKAKKEETEKKEEPKKESEEAPKGVEAILNKAKEQGQITYGELANELVDANPEQIDQVFDAFEELGVDVLKDDFIEPEIEDLENVEEIPLEELENPNFDDVAVDDPVRMYLREIVRIPLLSYDEEAE